MAAADDLPAGTLTYFRQTTAPTTWTKSTTYNDAFIRIVTGSASSGGSSGVSVVFTSGVLPTGTAAASVPGSASDGTTLSADQVASHTHTITCSPTATGAISRWAALNIPNCIPSSATLNPVPSSGFSHSPGYTPSVWGGAAHSHPLTLSPTTVNAPASIDFAVKYVDIILAEKDAGQNTGAVNFPVGTAGIFAQTAAPTGWTKETTNYNDHTLRLVTGSVASGGTVNASALWTTQSWTGTVTGTPGNLGNTTLTSAQIPYHSHPSSYNAGGGIGLSAFPPYTTYRSANTATLSFDAAGGVAHNHSYTVSSTSWTAGTRSFAVKYVDSILATKD